MKKIVLLCFIIIATIKTTRTFGQVNTQDSLALVDLYDSTGGANWSNHSGWLAGPVSTWYGITVAANRVISIMLNKNELGGILPYSIGNLSKLQSLDINQNYQVIAGNTYRLSGLIPPTLGQLIELDTLDVFGDYFSGSIPASLGNLINLKYLELGDNGFSGSIPLSFGQLTNLTCLDIAESITLSGNLPASVLNLPNLEVLSLWLNQLSGNLPEITRQNSKLKILYLGANNFTGSIPSSFGQLTDINILDLSDNKLTGSIPATFGQLANLNNLFLLDNQLSDSIPSTLTNLNNIAIIYISSNEFTFSGMENIATKFGNNSAYTAKLLDSYSPQATIPLNLNGKKLSVSVGGGLANETFTWSKNGLFYVSNLGDSTLTVTENGSYSVAVTDAIASELTLYSVSVYVSSLQIITTSVNETCNEKNGSITATGSGGTEPYSFSIDGINFQSNDIFTSLSANTYRVIIKDVNGLIDSTNVTITNTPVPVVNLGDDTTLCVGNSIELKAPVDSGYQYLWQDGNIQNIYTVSQSGTYWLEVTNQYNCSAADTVIIHFTSLPVFSIGNDTSLCTGQTLTLNVSIPNGSYLWSTGSTSSSLIINTAGLYWLNASDSGCSKSDSIMISYKPAPKINLGNDTSLCEGQTLLLNALNNNASYVWQDGSRNSSYLVTSSGLYFVTADINDCTASDSINIK